MSLFMPKEYAVKATTFTHRGAMQASPPFPSPPTPLRGSPMRGRTSVSDSRHASIGGPGRAGHIRGLVRGKEKHHRSNLFRLPGAPQGNGTQQTIKLLVVLHEIFRHGCIRETRDNSVDPDAVAGIIVCHHPCPALHTSPACPAC